MPRERKTLSGEPAQQIRSTPGVRYGEGVELQQLQQNVPTPDARTQTAPSAQTPSAPPAGPGEQLAPRPMPTPGALTAPTQRPNEPLTAGLRSGAGPGPEGFAMNPTESPTGRFLRELTAITGREKFAELARRSGL